MEMLCTFHQFKFISIHKFTCVCVCTSINTSTHKHTHTNMHTHALVHMNKYFTHLPAQCSPSSIYKHTNTFNNPLPLAFLLPSVCIACTRDVLGDFVYSFVHVDTLSERCVFHRLAFFLGPAPPPTPPPVYGKTFVHTLMVLCTMY